MKFVDTDVLIDFYRKYQPAIDFLDYYYSRNEILAISPITQMELYVGCRNKRELTEMRYTFRPMLFATGR